MVLRLMILQAALLVGLGSVFLLPKETATQPIGVVPNLPRFVGPLYEWEGKDQEVSQLERDVLGHETQFARKLYRNVAGDEMYVSLVIANRDMNTSIHRPERCLPAQGWTVAGSRTVEIALDDASQEVLHVTRLHNTRPLRLANEERIPIYNLNYYWFAGFQDVTPSHFKRNIIDVRDRLLHGYNQRWTYVTVAATVTKDLRPLGRSEAETDELIQVFIQQLAPLIHADSIRYR